MLPLRITLGRRAPPRILRVEKLSLLIDTNILIPLEPTSTSDFEPDSGAAIQLIQLCQRTQTTVYLHPYQQRDLDRDTNQNRQRARRSLSQKYPSLVRIPHLDGSLTAVIGQAEEGSNDWVDDHLLAAVARRAVNFLVTQDKGIHKKATRAGLSDRVLDLDDAIAYLGAQVIDLIPATPGVREEKAYNVNWRADIFDSLRSSYEGFDEWTQKCASEGRDVFLVDGIGDRQYAAVAVLNVEQNVPRGLSGRVLKLCTFKVSESHVGNKLGELLLKNVFSYSFENRADWLFVEVGGQHPMLIALLEQFGFTHLEITKPNGDKIFAKPILATDSLTLQNPFEYHVRHGPRRFHSDEVQLHVIPIQARFDELLFPERQSQPSLFATRGAFANSIRKAYICNSPIRRMKQGDLVAFYRSEDEQSIGALGVIETILVSRNVDEVTNFVGKITVYERASIEKLCQQEVLAVIFRQAVVCKTGIPLSELLAANVLNSWPQSITTVSEQGKEWLVKRIAE